MVYPEFGLLIPSNDKCMDVLGLGKEKDHVDARWHYVLDETNAEEILLLGGHPKVSLPSTWQVFTKMIKVDLPHVLSTKKHRSKTKVMFLDK